MEKKMEKARKILEQNLPDDMIVDVLSRLPVKSLHRFLCVSKSMYSLICPHFIRSNKIHQKFLFWFKEHYYVFDCYEATFDSDVNASMLKFNSPIKRSPLQSKVPFIHASCDSWLLLSSGVNGSRQLFLFNPDTKEYKVFPAYGSGIYISQPFGFWYDDASKDYKVVCMDYGRYHKRFLAVFSSESNSWKSITFFPDWIGAVYNGGVSVNGALHWVSDPSTPKKVIPSAIFSLDLKYEFQKLPGPPDPPSLYLASLRGNLCASADRCDGFVLWEMKHYALAESWTQVCLLRSVDKQVPLSLLVKGCTKQFAFTEKGELIIATREKVFIYNEKHNSFKSLMTFNEEKEWSIATYAYCLTPRNWDCSCNRCSSIAALSLSGNSVG